MTKRNDALLLLWKERGPTSQSILGDFKKSLGLPGNPREGIGHTGTLDPFAEGLLLVGLGEGTKLLSPLMGLSKTYEAQLQFGASTETLDDTSEITSWPVEPPENFEAFLPDFLKKKIGSFEQVPPQFSAVKVDGKRAYEFAREGKEVELKARQATLESARHLSLEKIGPHWLWSFECTVSSGTYIRALARDWSLEIFSKPSILKGLKRTAIGPFNLGSSPLGDIKFLQKEELTAFFDFLTLPDSLLQPFIQNGLRRFERAPSERPVLVLDELGQVWSYLEAKTAKTGRILKSPVIL